MVVSCILLSFWVVYTKIVRSCVITSYCYNYSTGRPYLQHKYTIQTKSKPKENKIMNFLELAEQTFGAPNERTACKTGKICKFTWSSGYKTFFGRTGTENLLRNKILFVQFHITGYQPT